ncbi:dienelactone hydrolase family protein [Kribbella sp. NPDC058245]|uniref:dienelactone hydrolase family protein n=1 Tax=Kribbella sp. NPDC058245 TaxID=3346399 RepID=UPI0036E6FE5B
MADTFDWVGEPATDRDVTERRFNLVRDTGVVPGILWLPAGPHRYPKPLVLLGHGGSGHKRAARQLGLGRWFASEWDIAAVAIDGPFHGDRQHHDVTAWIGVDAVTDGMVDDWTATLDALINLDLVDSGRVAYLGLSMGTRYGLPYVAAANRRLCCAVLGKYGLLQSPVVSAPVDAAARVARDAPRVDVPVLFHVQWDDELFPRSGQFELFDQLGSQDKQLIAFPGTHRTSPPMAIRYWCEFVIEHLAPAGIKFARRVSDQVED